MRLIAILTVLAICCTADGADRRGKSRGQGAWAYAVAKSAPAATPAPTLPTGATESSDALVEVNAERAKRGLAPFQHDPLLTQAAYSCAKERAARLIAEHVDDFAHLPAGVSSNGIVSGCGALDDSWGFKTCCWDENYAYAGAAWVRGSDGRRFMQLFVSNHLTSVTPSKDGATPTIEQKTVVGPTSGASYATYGTCTNGTCGTVTERWGRGRRR